MNQTATPEPSQIRRMEPGLWKIPSSSRPGFCHTTRLHPASCTCEWHRTGSAERTGQPCFHLKLARAEEEEIRLMEQPAPVQDPEDFDPFSGHPLETPDVFANAPEVILCDGCGFREVLAGVTRRGERLCVTCMSNVGAPALPPDPYSERSSVLWPDLLTPAETIRLCVEMHGWAA